jgi:NAD(P)-dependent dehydrogenase (short-subunit alcohol dehydrogenase family)
MQGTTVDTDGGPRAEPGARRIAIVTGASRGIGAGIAVVLKAAGITVIGISKFQDATAVDRWIRCDVSDPDQVEGAVSQVEAVYGGVDILVNCAGIGEQATLTETSLALWCETIDVNLTGTFLMMRRVVPSMLCRQWGRIVNIASMAGRWGDPEMVAYAASKHGILGLTRSVALQVGRSGVTVNALCPSVVDGGMTEDARRARSVRGGRSAGFDERMTRVASPPDRLVQVWEVATLVGFLVSEGARSINGQGIDLCAGAASV